MMERETYNTSSFLGTNSKNWKYKFNKTEEQPIGTDLSLAIINPGTACFNNPNRGTDVEQRHGHTIVNKRLYIRGCVKVLEYNSTTIPKVPTVRIGLIKSCMNKQEIGRASCRERV